MVEWIVWLNEIPTPTECEGKREREKKDEKIVLWWKNENLGTTKEKINEKKKRRK